MKAILKNGTMVGCRELARKPANWFFSERVLIVYEEDIIGVNGMVKYSNSKTTWVPAYNVFTDGNEAVDNPQ